MVKSIGRNDQCWCGSGKKYKKCHLGREEQEPLPLSKVLKSLEEAKFKKCLHPLASPEACSELVIRAHTVPRASLLKIARDGHVCRVSGEIPALMKNNSQFVVEPIGINKASTFTGFCSRHDNSTFEPFEKGSYQSREEAAFLLAYRAICVELYKKIGSASVDFLEMGIDRGRSEADQVGINMLFSEFDEGNDVGLRDLRLYKGIFDEALLKRDFSRVRYVLFELDGPPSVMCSGASFPEYDFKGRKLQDLMDLGRRADIVTFSAMADGDDGWLLFSWLEGSRAAEHLVDSLCELEEGVTHAVLRYIFSSFENTYMSPVWWESLRPSERESLLQRMLHGVDLTENLSPSYLRDDGLRVVDWKIKETYTNRNA